MVGAGLTISDVVFDALDGSAIHRKINVINPNLAISDPQKCLSKRT